MICIESFNFYCLSNIVLFQVEVDTGATRSVVGGQTIRLVDDVFSRTCQAINDVRGTVRVLAAKLIGEMKGVSQGYLEQVILASYWSILLILSSHWSIF